MDAERIRGHLGMLLLTVLAAGPAHGYALSAELRRRSGELLVVMEGSLYPALHRLELQGFILSEWGHAATGHRAKYYRLSTAGRKSLAQEESRWARMVEAIGLVLAPTES